ncbi:MAG TPA: hypothetical protein VN345_06895, partial [Blastocatellia bacterium]|nr:hypothetical protein [Blastocatellia bacterium]
KRNVLIGGQKSNYPDENFFPGAIPDVGFSDPTHGDYALASPSPFKKRGSDGLDIGCDISELHRHLAASWSGASSGGASSGGTSPGP